MGPLRNLLKEALVREWRQRPGLKVCNRCGCQTRDPDLLRCRSCETASREAERAAAAEFFRTWPFVQ